MQEHSHGHEEYPSTHASRKPHFNVREYNPETGNADRTKTLLLRSVANHYVF
ncbi:HNH/endonuclease VII fold putative polymorphic toxin [Pseudomonas sp. 86_A]|uniref:HNH/endonuclease VII fold putative polymorphic toxin n=1 Tax=Pseudomonas sp. 86_A TaxID=2813569 RepID=UPI00325FD795